MGIVFEQIDGTVQPENGDAARAPAPANAESGAPELDLERMVRELVANERRRVRLLVD